MTKTTISNTDDLIDSRDVIERIEELEAESQVECGDCKGVGTVDEAETPCPTCNGLGSILNPEFDDQSELDALKALADECEGYGEDWQHGATLIRDSYFEDYARELAEDIGAIKPDMGWPYDHIDWEAASEALQMDYTEVDFDGVSYWVRS